MARTVADLPKGTRLADYISVGVLAKTFPPARVNAILAVTKKTSVRQRELPAHVVVYYVMGLALYMHVSYREVLRCMLEGVQWLRGPAGAIRVPGKSAISQARTRLGAAPLQQLYD